MTNVPSDEDAKALDHPVNERQQTDPWKEAFQAVNLSVMILSPDHTIIETNPTTQQITGLSAAELRGKKCYQVFHGTDNPPPGCPLLALKASDTPQTREMEVEALGRTFLVSVVPLVDDKGAIGRIVHVATDITEHKRSEALTRGIIESSKDCIKILDPEGNLLYMSPAGQELLEIDDIEPYLHQSWIDFWHGDVNDSARQAMSVAASGGVGTFEGYSPTAKGVARWWDIIVSPIIGADGKVERLLAVSRDITARKQMEGERERLLAEAEAAREEAENARKMLVDIFERISDGIVALNSDWRYTYVNRKAALMLNRDEPEDLLGKHIWTEYPEGVGQPFYKAYCKAMETQKPVYLEDYYQPWDRWFENRIFPSPDGITIHFTETTERVQAEEKLRKTSRALKALSESNQMMVRVTEEAELLSEICRIIVEVGQYPLAWIGFAQQDEKKTVRPVAQAGFEEGYLNTVNITWADTERGRGPTGTAIRTGKSSIAQDILTDPEFAPWREEAIKHGYASSLALPLHVNNHVLGALNILASEPDAFDADELKLLMELSGDLSYGIAALRSRAERMRAVETLQQERDRAQTYLDVAAVAMVALDRDGRITLVNHQATAMLGYREEELLAEDWFETCLPERLRSDVRRAFEQFMSGEAEQMEYFENTVLRKGGEERIIDWHNVLLRDEPGNITGTLSSGLDMTERRQAQETLVKSEARYRTLFENMLNGFALHEVLLDKEGKPVDYVFLEVNSAFEQLTGLEGKNIIGKKVTEVLPGIQKDTADWIGRYGKVALAGKEARFEQHSQQLDKWYSVLAFSPHKGQFATVFEDITGRVRAEEERERLESQLRQSQKLESIGTLASGVAHEINNPLTGIINYADLIEGRIADPQLKQFAQGIMKEGNRVAEIVKSLLYFSRQEKQSHSPARMEDIINASLTLIGAVLRKDQITVEKEIAPDLPQVRCRSQQIEQVIINLLTNARDALNQRYEGYHEDKLIRILVQPLEKDGIQWLRTTLEDHGMGISADVIDRIFDPFFTTKPRTEGTGLGLSVSYGIVKDHHGELTVESEPGSYTRFHLDLRVDNGWTVE